MKQKLFYISLFLIAIAITLILISNNIFGFNFLENILNTQSLKINFFGWGVIIILIAFVAEYVDATLGMGYGTTLTPVLLICGFEPMQVVPAILMSELCTGVLAGFTHHSVGNVDFKPKTMNVKRIFNAFKKYGIKESFNQGVPLHLKISLLISSCSVFGTIFAVILALNIPKYYMALYIGVLVIFIGLVILLTIRRTFRFSWKRITFLGLLASFNKGLSGGGYGPVITGGQLLAGVEGKNAIGITSLSEGITCLVGVVAYYLSGKQINWILAPYLVIGAVLSIPFSALTIRKVKAQSMKWIIGFATLILGTLTLIKVLPKF